MQGEQHFSDQQILFSTLCDTRCRDFLLYLAGTEAVNPGTSKCTLCKAGKDVPLMKGNIPDITFTHEKFQMSLEIIISLKQNP